MLKVDVRVKTCQVCKEEISLREALEVAAGISDMATVNRLSLICTDKVNETTKITELDVYDDDDHITDNVFCPVTLALTDTPVVCRECFGIHKPPKRVKVVFAICKVKELQKYLNISNRDIDTLGHITVLELLQECIEVGSVVMPHGNDNNEGVC